MGMPHNRSNLTTKTPYLEPDSGNTPAETKTEPTKKAASNKGKSKKPASETKVKVFVIDTSVLLHDHNAIKSFEDNRVAIPITVLEELDTFKVGNDTKNFEARECMLALGRRWDRATVLRSERRPLPQHDVAAPSASRDPARWWCSDAPPRPRARPSRRCIAAEHALTD